MSGTDKKDFPVLDFGIQETNMVGDLDAAEAFLSGEDFTTIEKEEEEVKKEEPKEKEKEKPAAKVKPIDPFAEDEEEEEKEKEEEDDEEEEEEKKGPEGKKPEEKKVEEKQEGEDDEDTEEVSQFTKIAEELAKQGIFTPLDKEQEIKTGEDLLQRFQIQSQVNATQWLDNFLARFGEDRKELFDAIFISGVDPEEYVPKYNEVQKYEGLDLTDVDNQKHVFREFYRRAGLKNETIEKNLAKALDYGDLEENITELHEQIVNEDKEALKEMTISKERAEQDKKRAEVEYRTGLQKTLSEKLKDRQFKGIPLTEQKAREVVDFLSSPKYRTPNGQTLTEFDKFILESKKPENIENRIIIALLKMDGFDFSKIEKNGVSKETNTLFSSLAQKITKSKNRTLETSKKKASGFEGL